MAGRMVREARGRAGPDAAPALGEGRDPAGDHRAHRARAGRPAGQDAGSAARGLWLRRSESMPRLGIGVDRTQIQERLGGVDGATTARSRWPTTRTTSSCDVSSAGSPNERASTLPARGDPPRRCSMHGVQFVLIGGLAAQAHGSPIADRRSWTSAMPATATTWPDLAETLGRAVGRPTRAPVDAADRCRRSTLRTLRAGGLFTLTTTAGDFDLLADPDPGFDYERLLSSAVVGDGRRSSRSDRVADGPHGHEARCRADRRIGSSSRSSAPSARSSTAARLTATMALLSVLLCNSKL